MNSKPDFSDLNAIAVEACDIWQAQLSALAKDPSARAELTKFLEPQRRLFADWTSMMQKSASAAWAADAAPASAPPDQAKASGVDTLKTAQLALRVAEMEKRLAALEDMVRSVPANGNSAARKA